MYYILDAKKLNKIRHLKYTDGDGWGIDFLKGQKIQPPKEAGKLSVNFECNKVDLPDFFEVEGATPIANKKLIKAFQTSGNENFQAFPIEIQFDDEVINGYYLFNITVNVQGIDVEATNCKKWGPAIMRILDLKLKPENDFGAEIFRDRHYKMVIFISENIKKAIEAQSITGCEIREANGWSDSYRF